MTLVEKTENFNYKQIHKLLTYNSISFVKSDLDYLYSLL
jgi:hypothetical protein